MSDPRKRWLLLVVALLGGSPCKAALGRPDGTCGGPEITLLVPDADRAKWEALLAKLSEHLRALPDLDRCAQLTLRALGDTWLLEVRTGDGRVASRPAATEAQVLRKSEALLTLPPRPPTPLHTAVPAAEPALERRTAAMPAAASVELGAGVSARLGGSPLFLAGGVTGFADAAVVPWLLGVSARWDVTRGLLNEPTLMDYYLMSTAVGVHVGRRFELASSSLDLLLGPNLVLETQDADDGQFDIGGTATDVRIDVGARLSGPRRSPLRAFGSADFELSPARLVTQHFAHPGLPALPSFSFGLALGVQWSSQ